MITVREVKTKKEQKAFINFPLDLYDGNPYFVPPLYSDELTLFKENNPYSKTCDTAYYLAYDGNKVVGRISGIIQKSYNEKHNEKRARFTRFDSIDNQSVAKALFNAVESWAIKKGMDTMCGPLGFSDLEREGLLIDGFDQLSTFEEQYNYDYYQKLIENLDYVKEVDWTESKINAPDDYDGSLDKTAEFILKRYNLHLVKCKSTNHFIKEYGDKFFDLLDKSYVDIYGTVPFTDEMKAELIKSFKLIVNINNIAAIADEDDNLVCFGLCFPSIAKAVQKSKGHLYPSAIIRLLKAIKKPDILDLGLVGVDPAYENRGISVVVSAALIRMLQEGNYTHAETNLNLEENYAIQNQWKRFKEVKHKRRRAFVKKIG